MTMPMPMPMPMMKQSSYQRLMYWSNILTYINGDKIDEEINNDIRSNNIIVTQTDPKEHLERTAMHEISQLLDSVDGVRRSKSVDKATMNTPCSDYYHENHQLLLQGLEQDQELLLQEQHPPQQQYSTQKAQGKQQQTAEQQQNQDYISITLNSHNRDRCLYLPCFPYLKALNTDQIPLLLANVSTMMLSANGLHRRYGIYYDGPLIPTIMSREMDSFMGDLFRYHFGNLSERLKVNMAFIDFNLACFRAIIRRFQLIRQLFYRRYMLFNNNVNDLTSPQQQLTNNLLSLEFKEMSVGLEFFLQLDVDLFYMKTCSFRGANPRSFDVGLFCKSNLPVIRYALEPCEQMICSLCEPTKPIVEFNSYRTHRFVNGYHAILNCPAKCQTVNIIYVLTCPCGQYDFIGSSCQSIAEVVESVRENGSRFIEETLLSSTSFHNLQNDINHFLNDKKENFRLYQHAARCPKVLQSFVNMNPHYSCFIPMTYDQAIFDDTMNVHQQSSMDHNIEIFIQHVPIPPSGYTFSNIQRQQQRLVFQRKMQFANNEKLWTSLDIYQASIIAVLPDNCSSLLRDVLECLFATHSEAKLNMFNLRTSDNQQFSGLPYHRIWCEDIVRPS
ncbi:unnamed protein product [Rotaria socialis]|uniref:Uncharacterized protein n=1 Tax=Rotaria socialis TaxID=392032 RepID=A0A818JW45_9BILA|nr:unnamed protein product [Rotaria socialis]